MDTAAEQTEALPAPLPFDVTRAFTFFFEDPEWIPKLAVGTLFAFLSPFLIGAILIIGYAVSLARRVREDRLPRLPEWDDFQEIFLDGLRGMAVTFAHKLPLMLLSVLMVFALIGGIFLGRAEGTWPEEFMFLGLPALFGGFVVVFVLALAIFVYLPAAMVRLVQTDRVVAAFDVQANVDFIRTHLSRYALALLAIVLAGLVAQLGFFVFCIGIFPACFWSMCVMGYVIGELAKLDEGRPGGREAGS
jgi:MFS family permease